MKDLTLVIEQVIMSFVEETERFSELNRVCSTWLTNRGNQILGSEERESYLVFTKHGYLKTHKVVTEQDHNRLFLAQLVKIATQRSLFVNYATFANSSKCLAQEILNSICDKYLGE